MVRNGLWIVVAALFVWPPAGRAAEPEVPANLRFPSGERAAVRAEAKGVQIYDCKASPQDAAQFVWAFRAPEAELSDAAGKVLGKHYAGPTWESTDGSKVVGAVRAQADAPAAHSIPWLLLAAKSTTGPGVFANVKSIQRIDTKGGVAPAACSATEAGAILRAFYTATYVFSVGE